MFTVDPSWSKTKKIIFKFFKHDQTLALLIDLGHFSRCLVKCRYRQSLKLLRICIENIVKTLLSNYKGQPTYSYGVDIVITTYLLVVYARNVLDLFGFPSIQVLSFSARILICGFLYLSILASLVEVTWFVIPTKEEITEYFYLKEQLSAARAHKSWKRK